MKSHVGTIVGWICAILVAAFNLFAGVMKFMPVAPGSDAEKMGQALGLTPGMDHVLGVLELAIVVLFLIPRTSTLGFVLMVGYLGGAFATNLTHGFTTSSDMIFFVVLFAVLTVSGWFRNPELKGRLMTGKA